MILRTGKQYPERNGWILFLDQSWDQRGTTFVVHPEDILHIYKPKDPALWLKAVTVRDGAPIHYREKALDLYYEEHTPERSTP
jgi:hypothetical protein